MNDLEINIEIARKVRSDFAAQLYRQAHEVTDWLEMWGVRH